MSKVFFTCGKGFKVRLLHIDASTCQKQRGVFYLEFHPLALAPEVGESLSAQDVWAWRTMPDSASQALPIGQQIIHWLDAQGIGWRPCGNFAAVGMMLAPPPALNPPPAAPNRANSI